MKKPPKGAYRLVKVVVGDDPVVLLPSYMIVTGRYNFATTDLCRFTVNVLDTNGACCVTLKEVQTVSRIFVHVWHHLPCPICPLT